MRKMLILLALLAFVQSAAWAAPRSKAQMQQLARQAIDRQCEGRRRAPRVGQLQVLRSSDQLQVIGYAEGGFAVVSADDVMPAVLGVSASVYSEGRNPNFEWWLRATDEAVSQAVSSQAPLNVTTPDPEKYPSEVAPMVTSKWYQEAPYNGMCPIYRGSVRCLTGCVATAIAQILYYHKTPQHGIGQRTIYYPKGRTSGEAVTADFENDYYDWDNMLDVYRLGQYTQLQADAVALLMRDCGVAANMEYGGPDEGSGAYSDDAAKGLRDYFGFEDAQCLERDRYSEPQWMDIIYRELSENGPVYYGGSDAWMGGHAFLFDGYDAEGRVSVNWGWAGDDDGYFYVSQLNPTGYKFNYGQDMIIGIKGGYHVKERRETVVLDEAGALRQALEADGAEGIIASLTVEGPLNAADFDYLRLLATEGGQLAEQTNGLRVLDLTKATLEQNTLHEGALKGCNTLMRLRLPETMVSMGGEALNGCTSLAELRVISKSVPTLLGPDVFDGIDMSKARLYVMQGLKAKFMQTEQWNTFLERNIFQIGTSVTALNSARFYGEVNPVFTYNVKGGQIEGTPVLSCEATRTSPPGRYPVHVSEGTVVNSEAVSFVDGFLLVKKVDGKATVVNAERYEGEPNPQFQLRYEGLVAHDVEPVWTEEPVFTTSAGKWSKPGEYMVYVLTGEAESYNMIFVPGKLTVKPSPSGISEVRDDDTARRPAYNLQGQRTTGRQAKGITVIGGRKVVR